MRGSDLWKSLAAMNTSSHPHRILPSDQDMLLDVRPWDPQKCTAENLILADVYHFRGHHHLSPHGTCAQRIALWSLCGMKHFSFRSNLKEAERHPAQTNIRLRGWGNATERLRLQAPEWELVGRRKTCKGQQWQLAERQVMAMGIKLNSNHTDRSKT